MAKSDFSKMCEPAKLYLIVSVIALIYGIFQRFSMITLGTNFIFVVLWTMVLNWICSIGMKTISWILVLLPYITLFLSINFSKDLIRKEGFEDVKCTTVNDCPSNAFACNRNTGLCEFM
jgi:hypothetical protein